MFTRGPVETEPVVQATFTYRDHARSVRHDQSYKMTVFKLRARHADCTEGLTWAAGSVQGDSRMHFPDTTHSVGASEVALGDKVVPTAGVNNEAQGAKVN